jgi:hypothetical protein
MAQKIEAMRGFSFSFGSRRGDINWSGDGRLGVLGCIFLWRRSRSWQRLQRPNEGEHSHSSWRAQRCRDAELPLRMQRVETRYWRRRSGGNNADFNG